MRLGGTVFDVECAVMQTDMQIFASYPDMSLGIGYSQVGESPRTAPIVVVTYT